MTAAPDGPNENALYELLPTVFRQRDIAQGYPLLALTKVFDHIRERLAAGVSDLELDWFIQTCPLDYVPLIGGLLGVEIAKPVRPEHRALVADTLAFRRRKGIAAALPKLVRDSAGWYSIYSPGPETPPSTWPLANLVVPFDAVTPVGLPVGLLRVWRLPVFAVVDATPSPVTGTSYYHFNPLGMDQPLFNVPNTPLDWVAAPPVTALPVPLTAAMLAADLARYNLMWPVAGEGTPDSLLYGPARGLAIRTQSDSTSNWIALQPNQIQPMSLAGYPLAAPDYPVLEGGTIDPAAITATKSQLTITFGDATAALSVDVPAKPAMSDLVKRLQDAIQKADIHAGVRVTVAAIKALRAGAVGDVLVIVPCMSAAEPLSVAPTTAGGANPLQLDGTAQIGLAAATWPLTPQLIGALTGAPANSVMTFSAPAGQMLAVPLPLDPVGTTAEAVAAAFAAALPACFVCNAGDQVVIVPPPAAPAPWVAATPPAQALGLAPAVAIDPELGRFSWPTAWGSPGTFSVDYGIAMPGAIGGIGVRSQPRLPLQPFTLNDGGDPAWLQTQISAWAQSTSPCTVLMLQGSVTRPIASQQLAPASGQSLWIVAASGSQPCVLTASPGTLSLLGPASGAGIESGSIALSGSALAASIALAGGAIDLALLDATLFPGAGSPALAALPPSDPPLSSPPPPLVVKLDMQRCVLGPIDLTTTSGHIKIGSSVLSALPVPDRLTNVLAMPAAMSAEFSRITLIGRAVADGTLHASDSLFDGVLACSGEVCLNHCYVTDLQHPPVGGNANVASTPAAVVTRCAACGKARSVRLISCLLGQLALTPDNGFCTCKDASVGEARDCATCTDPVCAETCPLRAPGQLWDVVQEPPKFAEPNAYPLPNFARLSNDNSAMILTGASNRDQVGAYNLAVPTARLTEFEAALRSGLLPGARLERRFET